MNTITIHTLRSFDWCTHNLLLSTLSTRTTVVTQQLYPDKGLITNTNFYEKGLRVWNIRTSTTNDMQQAY